MSQRTTRVVGPGDRVLVTGAAGGVGRHVVRALLDADCEVRAVDRIGYDEALDLDTLIEADEAEWLAGDLLELELDSLVKDVDGIIHLAAHVGLSESYDELVEINVDLVEMLYEAAVRAGVRHFVHFGTGTIYEPARGVLDEDAPVELSNAYEETKLESEERLETISTDEVPWTILRPAFVYGPHTSSMSAGLVTIPPILRNFLPFLPGFTGGARANWAHVEDVAAATMAVLGNPRAFGQIFNVADERALAAGEVLTAITEAYGLPIGPLIRFPNSAVLMAFSPVVDRDYVVRSIRSVLRQVWSRIARRHGLEQTPLRPKVDRSAILYVSDDTVLDASRLRELGWIPDHRSFAEGIGETIQWYQDVGWVPRYDIDTSMAIKDNGSFGFGITQTLDGVWISREDSKRRRLEVTVDSEFHNIVKADFSGHLNGVAWFEGLVEDVTVEGTIEVKPMSGQTLTYQFGFETDDVAYRCVTSASFNPLRPFSSMTRLEGEVYDQHGEVVGHVELPFDWADQSVPILLSFRPLTPSSE